MENNLKIGTNINGSLAGGPATRPLGSMRAKSGTIISYTVPWPRVSLTAFLKLAANTPRIYWESDKISLGFAGYGITARLTAQGPHRFRTIRRRAQTVLDNIVTSNSDVPAGLGPRLFGGFSFRADHKARGIWAAFPGAYFILPRYQLTRLNGQLWLTINHRLGPDDDPMTINWVLNDESHGLQQRLDQSGGVNGRYSGRAGAAQPESLDFKEIMREDTWHHLVTDATERIKHGDLDKVVLARARQLCSPDPVDPVAVLTHLGRHYPDCYRFLFEPVPGHAFYGATPELLAQVEGSALHAVALAGSIRRGSTPEEDEALGRRLLATPKERHEHALVVEAVKENLNALVADLNIAPQPGLCRLSNIQHIQTVIEGRLADEGGILSVVEALHPTPALGGRPRQIALELIQRLEPISRGWYGAPIGWLDQHGDGIFAVAIRSALSVGGESLLFAGAGIVADSEPDREWRETQLKFRPLMDALRGSQAK